MLRIVSFLATLLVYFGYVNLPKSLIDSGGQCLSKSIQSTQSIRLDNPKIGRCQQFRRHSLDDSNQTGEIVDDLILKLNIDEQSVAESGHVEGLKVESYDLNFRFQNRTHYEGSVEIRVLVKEKTRRIVLSRHTKAPVIDYDKIYLQSLCENNRDGDNDGMCIEKVLVMAEAFLLQLSKPLMPGTTYVITVPNFRSHAYDEYPETGSIGLATSGSQEQEYWGLNTIFQMRYARTVFPCFDYPNMKARFKVCLEHPRSWKAASNTPLTRSTNITDADSIRSCFQETPPIPTYVFSIALMENYTTTTLAMDDQVPLLELYTPTKKTRELRWILKSASDALRQLRLMTNFTYPLPSMQIYVVYPAPFWGVENFGLVTVEGAFMEQANSEKATMILNHEMIHQWLGNVVTISQWRDICLQEGMTAFLEWKLSEDIQGVSMKSQAEQSIRGHQRDYPTFLRRYNLTQHIADHCFGLPPLFLKLISDVYGFEIWQRILQKLLIDRQFADADIDFWDRLLVETTGDDNLKGYLSSWFGQPGFGYVFAEALRAEIQLSQGRADNYERIIIDDQTVKPFPFTILTNDGRLENMTVPKIQNYTYRSTKIDKIDKATNRTWFVFDPDNAVAIRKVYQLKNYMQLLCLGNSNSTIEGDCDQKLLTSKRRQSIWSDFCQALTLDAFPWGGDKTDFDKNAWLDFFASLIKRGDQLEKGCRCCLNSKDENDKAGNCAWQWNRECKRLRLMQMLGRNYTLPNENPFGDGPSRP